MPARARLSTCPWAAPPGLFCRCWAVLAASQLSLFRAGFGRAKPSVSGADCVLVGSTVHSSRGILGRLTGGAPAAWSSAAAATAWPGALGTGPRRSWDSLGRRLLARRSLGLGTHLGAEDKQTHIRLSAVPQTPRIGRSPRHPHPDPSREIGLDACPAPTPEINLPLDVTDASGATSVPTLFPILRSGRGRGDRAGVPETGFHGTGQAKTP